MISIIASHFYSIWHISLAEDNYYYTTLVEHVFTHCLIAYPSVAFKEGNEMAKHYKSDCITSKEFINILESLYKNNYALVKISSCYKVDENGIAVKKKIKMPIGKKALIFSFDDVNYDHKKMGLGMVDKIVINANGDLASSTMFGNYEDVNQSVEFIPILEEFIKNHPDFSIDGAKGVLNLTGYDGVLGYRTSHANTKNRESEIKKVKPVIAKLKQNGWEFACHSYGHYHMKKVSVEKFKNEINLWQTEVEPLIGKTGIYVYPYGEWEVFENSDLCEKHKALLSAGFALFCGVGMQHFYSYLPNKLNRVLFMDRTCIDGNTISNSNSALFRFFNPKMIIDSARLS